MIGQAVWEGFSAFENDVIQAEEKAKERGKARAEAAHYRDIQLARECAREAYLRLGRPISADDVRAAMSARFPDQTYGNWMGNCFKGAEWVAVGLTKSTTKGSHSNLLRTWVLA